MHWSRITEKADSHFPCNDCAKRFGHHLVSVCTYQSDNLPNDYMHLRVQISMSTHAHLHYSLPHRWLDHRAYNRISNSARMGREKISGWSKGELYVQHDGDKTCIRMRPVTVLFAQPCNRRTAMARLNYVSKRARTVFYTRQGRYALDACPPCTSEAPYSALARRYFLGPTKSLSAKQPMSTLCVQAKTLSSARHEVPMDLHATWRLIDWACNVALHLIEARHPPT